MLEQDGFIHGMLLDGSGYAKALTWSEVEQWSVDHGVLWLHFDYSKPDVRRWLAEHARLDPVVSDVLVSEETRPRSLTLHDSLLLVLRGVNLNKGAEPDDMVAIRIWADPYRIVSTRARKLSSVGDVLDYFKKHTGPVNSADLICQIADRVVYHISETVDSLEEQVSDLDEQILKGGGQDIKIRLSTIRRQIITIRRYLAPQREAFSRLLIEKLTWFKDHNRSQLRETLDQLIRHIEDLDVLRERASLLHESILSQQSEQLNQRMYWLSIVTILFLPLSVITGIMGSNVGGVPGAENPSAFWFFLASLSMVLLVQWLVLRFKKWL